ncbi:MAG: hypothetical protein WAY93_06525 [Atopobiaceae bacterium]|jgi:hypothetical protein
MDMKEWAKGLTEEQADALKGCKTSEEIVEFCEEQGLALPLELLDEVSGGGFADLARYFKG